MAYEGITTGYSLVSSAPCIGHHFNLSRDENLRMQELNQVGWPFSVFFNATVPYFLHVFF